MNTPIVTLARGTGGMGAAVPMSHAHLAPEVMQALGLGSRAPVIGPGFALYTFTEADARAFQAAIQGRALGLTVRRSARAGMLTVIIPPEMQSRIQRAANGCGVVLSRGNPLDPTRSARDAQGFDLAPSALLLVTMEGEHRRTEQRRGAARLEATGTVLRKGIRS